MYVSLSYSNVEPLSVFREGAFLPDQDPIVIPDGFSLNLTLRCLGHSPSGVRDLVWLMESEGQSTVTLLPENNDNYTIISYGYNEANLTIVNSIEPYRGVLRCQSAPSGMQATFFVLPSK